MGPRGSIDSIMYILIGLGVTSFLMLVGMVSDLSEQVQTLQQQNAVGPSVDFAHLTNLINQMNTHVPALSVEQRTFLHQYLLSSAYHLPTAEQFGQLIDAIAHGNLGNQPSVSDIADFITKFGKGSGPGSGPSGSASTL